MPLISYLTILDRFTLTCAAIVVLSCFEAGLLGGVMDYYVDLKFEHMSSEMDGEGASPSGAQRRRLRTSSSDGHGMDGNSEEEVLWEVSRSQWLKKYDVICLVLNMSLLCMAVLRFYCKSQESAKSKRERDEEELEKRASMLKTGTRKSLV